MKLNIKKWAFISHAVARIKERKIYLKELERILKHSNDIESLSEKYQNEIEEE